MKSRQGKLGRVVAIAIALWLAGCATTEEEAYFRDVNSRANVFVAPTPSRIHKIAIMPFKAQTDLIGTSVSDLFVTEMLRARRYELVERGQMAKVLSESELALAGLSAARAAEVGHMLGAEGVVIGTVDEYATVAQSGHPYPVVGITARLIDCTSGKVMWSADLAKRASSKDLTLPEQARVVAHEMIAGLYQHWHVQAIVERAPGRGGETEAMPAPDQPVARTVSAPAAVIEAAPVAVPMPVDFKVSDMGLREVVLTWNAPKERELSYRIERAPAAKGPFTALATVAASKRTYRDQGSKGQPLQDGTAYYYRLVTVADRAESAPAPVKESLTAPPPEPPTQLRAEAPAARTVQLFWKPSSAEQVARYAVERAGPASTTFEPIGETDKAEFRDGATLQDGATYSYRVTAINRVGAVGQPTAAIKISTRPPPAPVQKLMATAGELRCVPLSWQASAEEDVVRYDLLRAGPDGKFSLLTSVQGRNSTTWMDGTAKSGKLADGTLYAYRICAINAAGVAGATSAVVKAMTHGAPPAVTGVQAVSGLPREIGLTWQASPDPFVTGYEIERSEGADGPFGEFAKTTGRTATNRLDRGETQEVTGLGTLKDGWTYRYRVRALNATELPGAWSAACIARTKPLPPAPDKIEVAYGSGWVKLAWVAPRPDITTYYIWKKGTKEPLSQTAQTEFVLRFGDIGRRAVIALTAVEKDGLESNLSVPLELEEPAPLIPQNLVATTNGLREVMLRWSKPTDNAKHYRIERASGPNELFGIVAKVSPGDGEYRDAGLPESPLADATAYYYRLVALAANGRASTPSPVAIALTAPPPAPPIAIKAEPSAPRKLKVTWNTSPSEGVIKYVIERALATDPEKFHRCGEVKEAVFEEGGSEQTDLKDSTAYLYRISVINRVGSQGVPSQPVEVTTQPPPAPPAEITATAPASRAIHLTWPASTAEWVCKYIVERAPAEAPENFAKRAEVSETSFSEGGTPQTDLRDSTKYLYRITAINRLGAAGPASTPVEVTTRPPPAAVRGFTAQSDEVRCVPLTWLPSPEPDVVRYDLYRRDAPDRAFEKIGSVEGRAKTTFLDGGRDPGNLADQRAYDYRIRAINAVTAESADSEAITATTRGAPPAVMGLRTKAGRPREIPLAWEASPDEKVIGYEILRQAPGEKAFTHIAEISGREQMAYADRGNTRRTSGLGQLADGAEYSYQVIAFNTARVRSAPSTTASARTKLAPAAPKGLTATTGLPKQIKLTWQPNAENDITTYVVEAAGNAKERFRELARVEATAEAQQTALEKELGDGTPRVYRIKAVDRDTLESPWSDVVAGATKPLPGAPTELKATWESSDVTLTWTPPPQTDIKGYKVWRKKLFGAEALADTPESKCQLTSMQVGKGITVLVSALDADGLESLRSAPLEITAPNTTGEQK